MIRKLMAVAAAAALLTGCGTVKIRQLLHNPAKYHSRNVSIEGDVTRSTGLFVAGMYQVDDGTGRVNVLSNRPVPPKGARVKVHGAVSSGAQVLGRTYGTIIHERDVRVR